RGPGLRDGGRHRSGDVVPRRGSRVLASDLVAPPLEPPARRDRAPPTSPVLDRQADVDLPRVDPEDAVGACPVLAIDPFDPERLALRVEVSNAEIAAAGGDVGRQRQTFERQGAARELWRRDARDREDRPGIEALRLNARVEGTSPGGARKGEAPPP